MPEKQPNNAWRYYKECPDGIGPLTNPSRVEVSTRKTHLKNAANMPVVAGVYRTKEKTQFLNL